MTAKRLMGKVAIVTGSSQGIGREICVQFHMEGAFIVCADLKESTAHTDIQQQGGRAIFVRTDVSSSEDMEKLIEAAVAKYGRIDV